MTDRSGIEVQPSRPVEWRPNSSDAIVNHVLRSVPTDLYSSIRFPDTTRHVPAAKMGDKIRGSARSCPPPAMRFISRPHRTWRHDSYAQLQLTGAGNVPAIERGIAWRCLPKIPKVPRQGGLEGCTGSASPKLSKARFSMKPGARSRPLPRSNVELSSRGHFAHAPIRRRTAHGR